MSLEIHLLSILEIYFKKCKICNLDLTYLEKFEYIKLNHRYSQLKSECKHVI